MSQDDDLGAFLRSEVPAPGPGYWEQIEAKLDQVEAEQGVEEPDPSADFGSLESGSLEFDSSDLQTDATVIRLTDMRHPETYPKPERSAIPMLAAAALVVIAATGALIALNRNRSAIELDAAAPTYSGITVEEGSVWMTTGTEPIQPLLSPAGEPIDAQFSIFPLIATGQRAEADDRVWTEMQAFGEQPSTWYPTDLLEKIADPLPSVEPGIARVSGEDPVDVRSGPGLRFDVVETLQPGESVIFTGVTALAQDTAWVLIDSEIPSWVNRESVTLLDREAIQDLREFELRQCFANDESLLVLDFVDADGLTFTARFDYLDSTVRASGVRDNGADPLFVVDTSAIGSAEDGNGPVIERESWEATDDGIIVGDRGLLPLVPCDGVAEQVAGLEAFIPAEQLLPIPN